MPLVQDQRLTAEDMDISQLDEELDFDSQTGVNQPLIAEAQPRLGMLSDLFSNPLMADKDAMFLLL